MKTLFILFLSFISFQTSYAFEVPELVKLKAWKVVKLKGGVLELSCKAVFYNPNNVKAKLTDVDLDVYFGETKVGNINQADGKVKITKAQAFEIPLTIKFSPETNAAGYFSGFLTAFGMQDFVIRMKGKIKVKALGIPVKVAIDESEEVNLREIISI